MLKDYDSELITKVVSQNVAALSIEKQYYDIQDANIVDTSTISGFAQNTATYKNNNGNPPYNTNPSANTGQVSKKLYKLNGQQGVKTGLGITLRVMSGDVVDVYGKSYWHDNGILIENNYNISGALMNFLGIFAGSQAVTLGGHGTDATTLFNNPNTTVPLGNWLNNSVPDPGVNIPKAYINWILFDEQFKVVSSSSGFSGVNATGDVLKTHHNTISIPKNGYLYVYCSNESNVDVFFDNLQVIHTRGPLIEETHYYPFGLTMAGISSKALNGAPENKYKFNKGSELQSKEFSDGSGLELYATNFRSLDPQLGRWWQLDPKPDYSQSMYSTMDNNPILINDPLGDTLDFSSALNNNQTTVKNVTSDLQTATGLTLSTNEHGYLTYESTTNSKGKSKPVISKDKNGKNIGSRAARKDLMKAINSRQKIDVFDRDDIGSKGGGLQININGKQIDKFINGTSSDLNNFTQGYGMTFLHELQHTDIFGGKSDPLKITVNGQVGVPFGEIGGPESRMNKVRRQLNSQGMNLGQRLSYGPMHMGTEGKVYLPFNNQSLNNINKGIIPTSMEIGYVP